jgi:hypothetical protein
MLFMVRRVVLVAALLSLLVGAILEEPVAAAPLFYFNYRIDATAHLKKLNQTQTIKNGTFAGYIDFGNLTIHGSMSLPKTTIVLKEVGIGVVTATAQIVQTKPVTGTIDISQLPFKVSATATFNIRILSVYLANVPVNLVGDRCTTLTPAVVTMKGDANIGQPSTFSSTFTIPNFGYCGAAQSQALTAALSGPGNTFTAVATPR